MAMPDDPRDRCVVQLLLGLTTETEQAKQHYLERALRELCHDSWVDQAMAEFKWDQTPSPLAQPDPKP